MEKRAVPMMNLAIATVLAASMLLIGGASAAPAPTLFTATTRDGQKDFDFLVGAWTTHYRLLKKRLSNDHEWYSCWGTSVVRPFWNGSGDLEDGDLRCPGSHIIGMTLRMYSPTTHQWSLWWGTEQRGLVPPPQVGHFDTDGVGRFYARDEHDGKPIVVRYLWRLLPGDHPYFAQAYSPDDGATWETNWTCLYTRAGRR